jgi:hypothetical protein
MTQTLRDALTGKSVSLTHGESLELVARILGFHDWNVLSAKIQSQHQLPVAKSTMAVPDTAVSPILPMRDIVLFPKMVAPIFVGPTAPSAPWRARWRGTNVSSQSPKDEPATMIPTPMLSMASALRRP